MSVGSEKKLFKRYFFWSHWQIFFLTSF